MLLDKKIQNIYPCTVMSLHIHTFGLISVLLIERLRGFSFIDNVFSPATGNTLSEVWIYVSLAWMAPEEAQTLTVYGKRGSRSISNNSEIISVSLRSLWRTVPQCAKPNSPQRLDPNHTVNLPACGKSASAAVKKQHFYTDLASKKAS